MRGPKRPGDFGDPVADNIRREMQADAMPTKEEVEADHRRFLAEHGCRECGEADPDALEARFPETHNCPALQQPDPETPLVYCDACYAERPSRHERITAKLDADDRLGLLFACGNYEFVEDADPSEADAPYLGPVYQRYGPLECHCGAEIVELFY